MQKTCTKQTLANRSPNSRFIDEAIIKALISKSSRIDHLFAAYSYTSYGEDTVNTINRKKTIEKENEEERPIFKTLFIAGCLYKTAKHKT